MEPVTEALAKDGWHRSGAAVVFYNLCSDRKVYRLFNGFGRLKFMGTYLLTFRTPRRKLVVTKWLRLAHHTYRLEGGRLSPLAEGAHGPHN